MGPWVLVVALIHPQVRSVGCLYPVGSQRATQSHPWWSPVIFMRFLAHFPPFFGLFCHFSVHFWLNFSSFSSPQRSYRHPHVLTCIHPCLYSLPQPLCAVFGAWIDLFFIFTWLLFAIFASFGAILASNPPFSAPEHIYERPQAHASMHSHSQMYLQRSCVLISPLFHQLFDFVWSFFAIFSTFAISCHFVTREPWTARIL